MTVRPWDEHPKECPRGTYVRVPTTDGKLLVLITCEHNARAMIRAGGWASDGDEYLRQFTYVVESIRRQHAGAR